MTGVHRCIGLLACWAVAVCCASCQLAGTGRDGDAAGPHAYAVATCAPTDGAAFDLVLTDRDVACEGALRLRSGHEPGAPYTRIFLYGTFEPVVPSVRQIDEESMSDYFNGGMAHRCPAEGECVPARSGTIRFEGDEGSQRAHVALLFEDGTREERVYTLRRCEQEPPVLCG